MSMTLLKKQKRFMLTVEMKETITTIGSGSDQLISKVKKRAFFNLMTSGSMINTSMQHNTSLSSDFH